MFVNALHLACNQLFLLVFGGLDIFYANELYSRKLDGTTILPAKSDSDVMFCLQCYQRLITDKSLVH